MEALLAELNELDQNIFKQKENNSRKIQVGTGERGDKRRTYRFQEDRVMDHITGKTSQIKKKYLPVILIYSGKTKRGWIKSISFIILKSCWKHRQYKKVKAY